MCSLEVVSPFGGPYLSAHPRDTQYSGRFRSLGLFSMSFEDDPHQKRTPTVHRSTQGPSENLHRLLRRSISRFQKVRIFNGRSTVGVFLHTSIDFVSPPLSDYSFAYFKLEKGRRQNLTNVPRTQVKPSSRIIFLTASVCQLSVEFQF